MNFGRQRGNGATYSNGLDPYQKGGNYWHDSLISQRGRGVVYSNSTDPYQKGGNHSAGS